MLEKTFLTQKKSFFEKVEINHKYEKYYIQFYFSMQYIFL